MRYLFDAGALIALERGDVIAWRRLSATRETNEWAVTHGGIVGQVWRGKGARHALLARALASIDVRPLDQALGRAAGALLAKSKTADVVDAALVVLARDDDQIVTSDPDDIEHLLACAGIDAGILPP